MSKWSASQTQVTKDAALAEYLEPKIAEAEAQVRERVREHLDELVLLQQAVAQHKGRTFPGLDLECVDEWLEGVTYAANHRRRVIRRLATAHPVKQEVTVNPHYVHEIINEQVLDGEWDKSTAYLMDTLRHELAHLFSWKFFGAGGHGRIWKRVAEIFGAAPWGCTRRQKRMAWLRRHGPEAD